MKLTRYTLFSIFLLVLVAAIYRVIPNRPWGFAPQFAMTLFCGAVMKDRKIAFLLPLVSMFISDIFYQFLYIQGLTVIQGFYDGMIWNYLIFGSLTFVGFFVNASSVGSILKGSIISPSLFFIVSNFITWMGGGGLQRPKSFTGLMQAFADGLPFYGNSVVATLVFGFILFGTTHYIIRPLSIKSSNY
jgi:hypothetical protein